MSAKKLGMRLRYLQQQQPPQYQRKRDISPNTANRKRIFEKLAQQDNTERLSHDKKFNKPIFFADNRQTNQYEMLVQNLKRKSIQIQLKDSMIKNLNREIYQLKRQVQIKDQQIVRLINQLNRLQRVSRIPKEIQQNNNFFESFKGSQNVSKNKSQEQYSWNKCKQVNYMDGKCIGADDEISMMNLLMEPSTSAQIQVSQPEILSPFMASLNRKAQDGTSTNQLPIQPNQRQHAQTFHGYSGNKTGNSFQVNSITSKSNLINPFQNYAPQKYPNNTNHVSFNPLFSKNPYQVQHIREQPRRSVQVNRNVEKNNLFGQSDTKSQVRPVTKLQIDDSTQFKFESFRKEQNDF